MFASHRSPWRRRAGVARRRPAVPARADREPVLQVPPGGRLGAPPACATASPCDRRQLLRRPPALAPSAGRAAAAVLGRSASDFEPAD
eukprot:scaffold79757_cov55-Phaeocystis_antarctica.AAC.1